MPSFIRNPRDFWSGVMFLFFGISAIYIAGDYAMGSAGRMGPAYFPTALGWILVVIGGVCVARSIFTVGEAMEKIAFKQLFLILIAVILFGVVVRGAGLIVAIPLIIVISAVASTKFRVLPSVALAAGATVFSVLLFVKALGLPMPILGSWFGY